MCNCSRVSASTYVLVRRSVDLRAHSADGWAASSHGQPPLVAPAAGALSAIRALETAAD